MPLLEVRDLSVRVRGPAIAHRQRMIPQIQVLTVQLAGQSPAG